MNNRVYTNEDAARVLHDAQKLRERGLTLEAIAAFESAAFNLLSSQRLPAAHAVFDQGICFGHLIFMTGSFAYAQSMIGCGLRMMKMLGNEETADPLVIAQLAHAHFMLGQGHFLSGEFKFRKSGEPPYNQAIGYLDNAISLRRQLDNFSPAIYPWWAHLGEALCFAGEMERGKQILLNSLSSLELEAQNVPVQPHGQNYIYSVWLSGIQARLATGLSQSNFEEAQRYYGQACQTISQGGNQPIRAKQLRFLAEHFKFGARP